MNELKQNSKSFFKFVFKEKENLNQSSKYQSQNQEDLEEQKKLILEDSESIKQENINLNIPLSQDRKRVNFAVLKEPIRVTKVLNSQSNQQCFASNNQCQQSNLDGDRFIPVRGNQKEIDLQDLLFEVSGYTDKLDTSDIDLHHRQKSFSERKKNQKHFKGLLASQILDDKCVLSRHESLSKKTLSQNCQLQRETLNYNNEIPGRILSFRKEQTVSQHTDNYQIEQDERNRGQFINTFHSTKMKFDRCLGLESNQSSQVTFQPRQRSFPLPQQPHSILGTPNILDEVNNNLLDWAPMNNPYSKKQLVSVAIFDTAYMMDPSTNKSKVLVNIRKNQLSSFPNYICSLNFDRSGEAIALGCADGTLKLFDVERQQQIRNIKSHVGRIQCLSWNRSVLSPYLITTGSNDTKIINHDVRMKNAVLGILLNHTGEICSLSWSTNQSYQQMKQSDPSSIYLASGSTSDKALGIWRLNDLIYGSEMQCRAWLFDTQTHISSVKATAWNPNYEGVFATGGGSNDQIIRVWDFKKSKEVQHSIRCNSLVTSLGWRKGLLHRLKRQDFIDENGNPENQFCEELLSCHGKPEFEMKLWQINKYQNSSFEQSQSGTQPSTKKLKYWFTKIKDWYSHNGRILGSAMSPDSENFATLGQDETLRIWKLFDKVEPDCDFGECDNGAKQKKKSTVRKKFERYDSQVVHKSLKSVGQNQVKMHSRIDLTEQLHDVSSHVEDFVFGSQSTLR